MKIADTIEKISETVTGTYQKIQNGVVDGYQKMENGVIRGFEKVTDRCVETLFARKNETVEQAKQRLSGGKTEKECHEDEIS